ncbi:hypothetical protein GH714_020819 [Hevea brasiliensis]|uniref:Transposase MuDR plant domain-containing protein n=1 Tax=Hevea brasiliensis TaxID=3981 RepID=A0A6A6KUW5_HEVBR|nr:hypothetical protein GH714_020819 [Hevea brasiliensis]
MATPSTSEPIKILRPGGCRFFTIILHVKGVKGEWGYYDGVTWTIPFCQDNEMEANVDSNIEIVNDVQCETSVSEHCVNEENSDGSVRAKEVNVDDGFNEYIDTLKGKWGYHAMNAREGVNVEEGNPNRSGLNAQADDELQDNEYEMEEGDEDVQDVLHGINTKINNDNNNQKQNQKGRPKATEERMRNEGFGASLRLFPEFNMDMDINDPTLKVGMIFSTGDEFKDACRAYGIKHRFELYFPKNDFQRRTKKKLYAKSSKTRTTDTNAKAAPTSSPTTVQWMMDGSSQRPTRIPNNVEDTMTDANVFRSLQTSYSQL